MNDRLTEQDASKEMDSRNRRIKEAADWAFEMSKDDNWMLIGFRIVSAELAGEEAADLKAKLNRFESERANWAARRDQP